jgi:L-arabinose isomerase
MQHLYDAMLPGITERQAAYAGELASALGDVASVVVSSPVKDRDDVERAMRELEGEGLDGLLVVMLTYGPAMNIARALAETRLPVCVVNTQPVGEVSSSWDMADLTYNQGIHGAQDTANALVRASRPFNVISGDWHSRHSSPRWVVGSRRCRDALKRLRWPSSATP